MAEMREVESMIKIMSLLKSDFKDGVYTKDDYRDNMLNIYDVMESTNFDEDFNFVILQFIRQLREDFNDGIYTVKEYKIGREKLIDKISIDKK